MATRRPTTRKPAAPADVGAFLDAVAHPRRDAIERLRTLIRGLDPRIVEEVKWNAPSFRLREHFATFRLHPPTKLQVVLHTGATARGPARAFTVDDPTKLLAWPAPDRAVMTVPADEAWADAEAAMHRILQQWVAQLDEGPGTA